MKEALPLVLILTAVSAVLVFTNLFTGVGMLRQRSQNRQLQQRLAAATNQLAEEPLAGNPSNGSPNSLAFAISRTTDVRLLKAVLDAHRELLNTVTAPGRVTRLRIAGFTG